MQPLRLDKSELFQYRVTLLPASHGRRHHSVLSYQGCRHDQHGRAQPSWWDRGGLDPYSKTWGDSSYIVSLGTTAASRNRKSEHWGDHPSLWMPVPSHHCGPEKEVRPQFFVSGADLRRKRRRIIVDDTAPVRAAGVCLSEDNYLSIFEGEIRRQEYFNFHSIRITFAGAGTVNDVTETGRAGFLFLWWSSKGWKLYDAQSSKLNESERRPSGLCYVSTRLAVENL